MSVEIRQPNITAADQTTQLKQMRSYLYQLSQQLNWAFSTLDMAPVLPAPGILPSAAREAADPAETFGAIKSLIIKSADIVNAYSEKIEKNLNGVYVAASDYGTFREETRQHITANAASITQLFSDVQTLRSQSMSTEAYLRAGLLCYGEDGAPVYGLEIGQQNTRDNQTVFDKFARFTSDKLSFYDSNDVEVAYISDYRMFITAARVTGELQLADQFRVRCDGVSLDFQWIGG